MNLGETIFKLRNDKNLSQEELANLINVSRQSISKWENNNSVPDLDKLIKLSQVFNVSLDELIKGESISSIPEQNSNITNEMLSKNTTKIEDQNKLKSTSTKIETNNNSENRPIIGTILLVSGFITNLLLLLGFGANNFLFSVIFASPLYLCGIICFIFKRNIGFLCIWAIYLCIDIYLQYGTGLSWKTIFQTFTWTYRMNYTRLAMGWIQFIVLALFVTITILKFRNVPIIVSTDTRHRIKISWIMAVLLQFILLLIRLTKVVMYLYNLYGNSLSTAINLIHILIDWASLFLLIYAWVNTIRYKKTISKLS